MDWWERVRDRRQELGLSGRELAESVGVSPQRISDVEAGRYPNAELTTLRAYATALDTTVGYLVDGAISATSPVIPGAENAPSDAIGGAGGTDDTTRVFQSQEDRTTQAEQVFGLAIDIAAISVEMLGGQDAGGARDESERRRRLLRALRSTDRPRGESSK